MKLKWCRFAFSGDIEPRVRKCMLEMMEKFKLPVAPQCTKIVQPKTAMSDLFDFMDTGSGAGKALPTPAAAAYNHTASVGLGLYLEDKNVAPDPLEFWRENQSRFPRLFVLAKQVLCAPGSTAGIERVFSVAFHILSNRRLATIDLNFENQLFGNVNYDFFDLSAVKKIKLN